MAAIIAAALALLVAYPAAAAAEETALTDSSSNSSTSASSELQSNAELDATTEIDLIGLEQLNQALADAAATGEALVIQITQQVQIGCRSHCKGTKLEQNSSQNVAVDQTSAAKADASQEATNEATVQSLAEELALQQANAVLAWAAVQGIDVIVQVTTQVDAAQCRRRCEGEALTQDSTQAATVLQLTNAETSGNQTAANAYDGPVSELSQENMAGASASSANNASTLQIAQQVQLGCMRYCTETVMTQAASQAAEIVQDAIAQATASQEVDNVVSGQEPTSLAQASKATTDATATNYADATQRIFQQQVGCVFYCVDVIETQTVEQTANVTQTTDTTSEPLSNTGSTDPQETESSDYAVSQVVDQSQGETAQIPGDPKGLISPENAAAQQALADAQAKAEQAAEEARRAAEEARNARNPGEDEYQDEGEDLDRQDPALQPAPVPTTAPVAQSAPQSGTGSANQSNADQTATDAGLDGGSKRAKGGRVARGAGGGLRTARSTDKNRDGRQMTGGRGAASGPGH